jgi:two-component system NtrC family response regulator
LRERREDVKDLVRYYVPKICEGYGIPEKRVSPEFQDVLIRYNWPGNVRELVHAIERAIAGAPEDSTLFPQHLPVNIRVGVIRSSVPEVPLEESKEEADRPEEKAFPRLQKIRDAAIAEAEQKYLRDLLNLVKGNILQACRISGLSRSRLYALLKKYRVSI